MYRIGAVAALLLVSAGTMSPLVGQAGMGGGDATTAPAGWALLGDGGGGPTLTAEGKGFHVVTNDGGLFYRTADDGKGGFHATIKFTEAQSTFNSHGYGVFFGGKDLGGTPQYTYFLIRADGNYLLKQAANGDATEVVSWTASPAIKAVDKEDPAVNVLEVDAKTDPKKVAFKVNGQSVYTMDVKPGDLDGVVGLRAGHGMDFQIADFEVHR